MFMFLVFLIILCGPVNDKYVPSAYSTALCHAVECLSFPDGMYVSTQQTAMSSMDQMLVCSIPPVSPANSVSCDGLLLFLLLPLFKMCLVSAFVCDFLQLSIYCSAG
jgi:hypothetical protein